MEISPGKHKNGEWLTSHAGLVTGINAKDGYIVKRHLLPKVVTNL